MLYQPFVVNGVVISDAGRDETGGLPVDPAAYYGPEWSAARVPDPPAGACCAECSEPLDPDGLAVMLNDDLLHTYCARSLINTYLSLPNAVPQGSAAPPRPAAIQLAEQAVLAAALAWARSTRGHWLGTPALPGVLRDAETALQQAVCRHQGLVTWLPAHCPE